MLIGIDIDKVIALPLRSWWSEASEEEVLELIGTAKPNVELILFLNKLSEEHEIMLVTGRFERNRKATEDWLAPNGVRYGKLLMNTYNNLEKYYDSKIEHINREGIEVMVDDDLEVVCRVNQHTNAVGYLYRGGLLCL